MKKFLLFILAALSVTAAHAQIDFAQWISITPGQPLSPEPGWYAQATVPNWKTCCTAQYTVQQTADGAAEFTLTFPVEKTGCGRCVNSTLYTVPLSLTVTDLAGNVYPGWSCVPDGTEGPGSCSGGSTWTYANLPAGTYRLTMVMIGYRITTQGVRYDNDGITYWNLHAE